MSKKMLKRSLALGALMAFVITGSAWAGEVDKTSYELKGESRTWNNYYNENNEDNINSLLYAGHYYPGVQKEVEVIGTGVESINFIGTGLKSSQVAIGAYTYQYNNSWENVAEAKAMISKVKDIIVSGSWLDGNGNFGNLFYAQGAKSKVEFTDVGTIRTDGMLGKTMAFHATCGGTITVNANEINMQSEDNAIVAQLGVKNEYKSKVSLTANKIILETGPNSAIYNFNGTDNDILVTAYEALSVISKGSNGIYNGAEGGSVNLSSEGNLILSGATKAISTEKSGSVEVSAEGVSTITGDIIAKDTSTVIATLNNAKSVFSGKIDTADGANTTLNLNGGTWNLKGDSNISNVTFGADSVLNIDGATYLHNENGTNVYALTAAGTEKTLTVVNGAKIAIEGIEEGITYNIAKGFGVGASEGENWTIDNNLMTGEWSVAEDVDGLQVTTKAKDSGEIAKDMGVDSGTASALAGIIDAVDVEPANVAQENVQAFAKAIANVSPEVAAAAAEAVVKMAEAGGNNATAASIVKNVTGVTNDRLSFNCGHSAPHKGGHGVGLLEEGSGADIWAEYVHGKDKVEDMKSTAGATSYEGQYNGFVMGVDFKKVNKFQSGIAFNYGEGDTNSVGTLARTRSDYDFWGVGYYGNIHNDDSNVIFDINYAKSDSDVINYNVGGLTYEASPETTTWTAGVKVEKLYQNNNVQIVPYTGLRYMSIDADDYATKCGTFNYKMDRQDIWLLPVGVSIRQEVTNDNGWTVSPRVDLSYIWAFGDTDSDMEFATAYNNKVTNIGYDVMDDGSFLGLVGIEAHKGQWGYGVAYSYQKGDHSESKKWYVDVNYSF